MKNNNALNAYGVLAKYYERLVDGDAYREWADLVVEKIKAYSPFPVGADLACGSGYFTRALNRAGLTVTGVDASAEMLNEAERKNAAEGMGIQFVLSDMRKFRSHKKLGFVTVINDGLNYIPHDDVKTVFSSIRKNLKKNGVLLFDISSEYKLREIVANNVFCEDTDDVTYIWFNTAENNRVIMDLTFFEQKDEDGLYARKDERHIQYIHSEDFISEALQKSGFTVVETLNERFSSPRKNSERIIFIAENNG